MTVCLSVLLVEFTMGNLQHDCLSISFTDQLYNGKFRIFFIDLLLIEYPYINKMSNYNPDFFLIKIINKCLEKKQYSN